MDEDLPFLDKMRANSEFEEKLKRDFEFEEVKEKKLRLLR
jgi:hypothetical protein